MNEGDLFDAVDDLLFVFDANGSPQRWNQAVCDVTGYSDHEIEEMTPAEFVAGAETESLMDAFDAVLATGSATVIVTLLTADGDQRPYEFKARRVSDGETTLVAAIGRDVRERLEQRDQLTNRERLLREMYEIIADRERPFTQQVEALLHLGRKELGTAYGTLSKIEGEEYTFEVVAADDDSISAGDVVPLSATNCEIAASTEETLVLGDIRRDAPEETDRAGYTEWGISCYIGAPVYVDTDVYGTFCFYDTEPRDGQFSEWEVTFVDLMSRWVTYELQRHRSNVLLEQQNEKLERFASIVSHDLRNPLSVVGGSIQLATETGELDHLTRASQAIERMNTLIDDLRTLARAGATIDTVEPVALDSVSARAWEHVPTKAATIQIETERTIQADDSRLQQLLENLFRNAIEHGGEAVTVTVGDLPNGFYVEDNGEGISDDDMAAVFESGYSTSPDGTGFGLAIVTEIADAHGWTVRVTNGSNGGARFECTGMST